MKIVISGFGPFEGQSINPSEFLVKKLAQDDPDITSVVLSVSFSSAFQEFKEVIDSNDPNFVVSFGVSSKCSSVMLERIAVNWNESRVADNDGVLFDGNLIDSKGADGIFSTFPLKKISELVDGCSISNSAGTYVCNNVMYKSLSYLLRKEIPYCFIHIPVDNLETSVITASNIISVMKEVTKNAF